MAFSLCLSGVLQLFICFLTFDSNTGKTLKEMASTNPTVDELIKAASTDRSSSSPLPTAMKLYHDTAREAVDRRQGTNLRSLSLQRLDPADRRTAQTHFLRPSGHFLLEMRAPTFLPYHRSQPSFSRQASSITKYSYTPRPRPSYNPEHRSEPHDEALDYAWDYIEYSSSETNLLIKQT